jgi:hypothetical protein
MLKPLENSAVRVFVAGATLALAACGSSDEENSPSPAPISSATGGAASVSGGVPSFGGAPGSSTGGSGTGGARASGGAPGGPASGGAANPPRGGANNSPTGGASAGSTQAGGPSAQGGAGTGTPGDGCTIGAWPAAEPTAKGPYETVTENEVGPEAGAAEDGVVPKFTLFRPKELSPNGLCHPVITWGNGTGSTPNLYGSLLNLFASHGFVVIASNSKNVAQGDPRPMVVGVNWILEQNEDPASALYHHLDVTHIGATGHSQGAVATSQASGDSHITTNIPIEGASPQRNLHGPAMFFCGGMDDVVGCDGAQRALDSVTDLPAMYAELIGVDHGSWMSRGNTPSASYAAFTAWMRVHLMGDDSLRPWFYGAACKLCTDDAWNIQQKNMDQ